MITLILIGAGSSPLRLLEKATLRRFGAAAGLAWALWVASARMKVWYFRGPKANAPDVVSFRPWLLSLLLGGGVSAMDASTIVQRRLAKGVSGHGEAVALWATGAEYHVVVASVDVAKEVVGPAASSFGNDGRQVGSLLSSYLIGWSGAPWRRVRHEVHAALHGGGGRVQEAVVAHAVCESVPELLQAFQGVTVDEDGLYGAASRFQLKAFLLFACNARPSDETLQILLKSYAELGEGLAYRMSTLLPWWLPTRCNLRVWRAAARLRRYFRDLLRAEDGSNAVAVMRKSKEETTGFGAALGRLAGGVVAGRLSEDEVVDNLAGLAFAAEDGQTLYNVVQMLAQHPGVQDKIHEELELAAACHSTGDSIDIQAQSVQTARHAVKETLRLWPTVPLFVRRAERDCFVGSVFLPRGSVLHLDLVHLSQLPHVWGDDAAEFRPARWGESEARHLPSYASLWFGSGSRRCMGQAYVGSLLPLCVCALVRHFRWELDASGADDEEGFGTRLAVTHRSRRRMSNGGSTPHCSDT
eukprot:TRINITY_DN41435_c0_g1_i1.p1 TRINITY_DN41435_c0_g1~~TRINITY_DN41435_c0_g1_i1.p1  ORF type:complete len:534 (+),score=84.92 TRINITY_DN41435_c0_g1_i1:23-1603(+)